VLDVKKANRHSLTVSLRTNTTHIWNAAVSFRVEKNCTVHTETRGNFLAFQTVIFAVSDNGV